MCALRQKKGNILALNSSALGFFWCNALLEDEGCLRNKEWQIWIVRLRQAINTWANIRYCLGQSVVYFIKNKLWQSLCHSHIANMYYFPKCATFSSSQCCHGNINFHSTAMFGLQCWSHVGPGVKSVLCWTNQRLKLHLHQEHLASYCHNQEWKWRSSSGWYFASSSIYSEL